jgi:radical SAM protein with 4Fe4S-binding SPASM domain
LDAQLEERIAYVFSTLYGVPVEIFTNGQFLTPKRFESLKAAGLMSIVVSLNAVNAEQHKKIMGLSCFEETCRNIDYVIKNSEHVAVSIRAVADGENFTNEDAKDFHSRWGSNANVILMGNWAGEKEDHSSVDPNSYCIRSDQTMYITYDGKVTMCCFDPTGKTVFGDLNHETLKEVSDGPAYTSFRRAHKEGRAAEYEQCADCSRI